MNRPVTSDPALHSGESGYGPASFARSDANGARRRRVLRWSIAGLCVLTMAIGLAPAVAQDSIEDAREQQRELEDEALRARTELHIVNAEFADVQDAYRAALELVQRQEARVAAAEQELAAAQLRQRQIDVAIQWAEYDLSALDQAITDVAVEAYLGDVQGDGVTLLQSENLQEGTTRIAMLELASSQSEDVVDLVRGTRERQEQLIAEQEDLVAQIEVIETALRDDLAELEDDYAVAEALQAEVRKRVEEWQAKLDEIEAQEAELESFIANKQAIAAGRQPNMADISTEGYIWPTAGSMGSGFGNRLHPVLGYYRMHSGADIGGAQGQPIYAANSGTVIVAGVQGGYGNAIVIDHGEGISTLYAHQSQFAVGVGAKVQRGDTIGYVGSTGMSTGPHLHFEVRLYGTPIDPLPFLP